ncbi:response regulator transcription factor [Anaerolineales bacterium HSG25]|nr:response regulator transcription factor [Anaerolineales bacterium HSG25]
MFQRIVVIDDDPFILQLIEQTLEQEEYEVTFASSGLEGLRVVTDTKPHLVILDIMMPDIDGWETCARIRELSHVPILMLTALGSREDIIRGLDTGADDYLPKPFHPEILLARVTALLRRSSLPAMAEAAPLRFGHGELVIDPTNRQVYFVGERLNLTPKEFELLLFFANRAGRVLSTEHIFENVWSFDTETNTENVKWYVWRLRKKIEKGTGKPKYIVTERGIGYRFVPHY